MSIAKGSINRVNNLKASDVKNVPNKTKHIGGTNHIDINKLFPVASEWKLYSSSPAHLDSLKESIGKFGVLEPVIARQLPTGDLQLLSGYLRVQACTELGISQIKCEILQEISDEEAREIFMELHRAKTNELSLSNLKFRPVSVIKTDLPDYLL